MAARDIEYVELYANDKHAVIDYFVLSLGFTRTAESADFRKSSTLLRQGSVQLIVTTGPEVAEFLDAHGDGVADIAFGCDDVDMTRDAVVAAGGVLVDSTRDHPVVSGFGGVCHTLLPRTESPGTRLPPGRRWTAVPGMPVRPAGRIARLDHVAICFEAGSLADHTDFYRAAFGLDWYSRESVEIADQAMSSIVLRSRSGGITFAMLEPDSSRSPGQLDSFLERNAGAGVQRLAFLVDAIIPAVDEYRHRGVEFLQPPDGYYDTLRARCPDIQETIAAKLCSAGILADRNEWGHLFQLFAHSPHERNTLFYELIQRSGALGFASANVRALYESVERQRLAVA